MEGTHLQFVAFLVFGTLCMTRTGGNTTVYTGREFKSRCMQREKEALLKFKSQIVDRDNQLSSWGTQEQDCCNWRGIRCTKTSGHVYALDLRPTIHYDGAWISCIPLQGEISSSLLELQHLTYLDLSNFEGNWTSIPKFIGSLKNLKYLNLSLCDFTGETLDHLGNLSRLVSLDLSLNYFENIQSVMFLSRLSDLKYLHMRGCNLSQTTDWLQAINMIPSLIHLDLSGCSLSVKNPLPPSPSNSSNFLSFIDFSSNSITSSIFSWLFGFNNRLIALKHLNLAHNNLVGDIPRSLGNLSSLEILDLSRNNLTGEVPNMQNLSSIRELHLEMNKLNGTSLTQSIGLLSKLEVLDLSSNSMTGAISDIHFLTLSKLWFLDVSYNSFTWQLSSNWVPPFQLKVLIIRSCKLGPHFPQWIQTQNRITYLDISNNGISDTINDRFWELPPILRYLNLSSNLITGEVSKLPSLLVPDDFFPTIDLSSNRFHGAIPQLPRNITQLNLSRNRFSGSISNLCSSSENLMYLDLSNNFLSGELPDCWMHYPNMTIINLADNNFSGTIPTSFGQMPLESLQLRNNSFSGELPPSLANCTSLQLVDVGENRLSGRIPTWIGENLSNLIVLRLRSNGFHGSIPKQLCNLASIQILDLSHNNISGIIPWCLSNFTAMVKKFGSVPIFSSDYYRLDPILPNPGWFYVAPYVEIVKIAWKGVEQEYGKTLGLVKCIDLSCNNFSGEVPGEITSLVGLISLNLSHNQLSGVIPGRINQMESLESLDFSANHLSGRLPEGLRDLNFLSYLNLSDNNFSGKIPTSTQLQTFSDTSFQGNAGLCGKPLPKSCPGEEDEAEDYPSVDGGSKNFDKQEGKDEIVSSGFYLSMGAGFATGFWAVCGALLLYRQWRHAYVRFLNTIGDWFDVRAPLVQ